MHTFQSQDTVGELVSRQPALSRVFEKAGIDYCCGGRKTLDEACRQKGMDVGSLIAELEGFIPPSTDEPSVDAAAVSLTELADHIEQTHHAYLRSELPRIDAMTEKVGSAHGRKDARLGRIRAVFRGLLSEMESHMMKEEQILFPMIRKLEVSKTTPAFHCGSIANPIRQMEVEHDEAGAALDTLRHLSDGFNPPDWACNTYRALLETFVDLENDMHRQVHKENNILFPRALAMENEKAT
ncbi:MAG: iron-sulfur cluster repair di-iron protein [candidate division Zixibacteria bacterium]|nr:iron-sulfur cluster repair di-iron protein [candidate division Zixibacteria bacterium]